MTRELVLGHLYELDNLKGPDTTKLAFYRDPEIHGEGWDGPSTQEVLRACIKRVQALDAEKPWRGNEEIIRSLRKALILFEIRALEMKLAKDEAVEDIPTNNKGHIFND